jgi:hypothetical protein
MTQFLNLWPLKVRYGKSPHSTHIIASTPFPQNTINSVQVMVRVTFHDEHVLDSSLWIFHFELRVKYRSDRRDGLWWIWNLVIFRKNRNRSRYSENWKLLKTNWRKKPKEPKSRYLQQRHSQFLCLWSSITRLQPMWSNIGIQHNSVIVIR